jgi:hypothetical protein
VFILVLHVKVAIQSGPEPIAGREKFSCAFLKGIAEVKHEA